MKFVDKVMKYELKVFLFIDFVSFLTILKENIESDLDDENVTL